MAFGVPLLVVPEPWARGAAAVLLAAIAGIYVGFAFAGESLRAQTIESAQALRCCANALAGLVGAWGWLAAGLFVHAAAGRNGPPGRHCLDSGAART